MQNNERESSFQRKSKVSPLPPFSLLAICQLLGDPTIMCVHELKSPMKYPTVEVKDDRNLYGKLRSPRARCEKAETRSPIIFYRGALTVGCVRINSPVKKGIISSKPRITEVS